MNESDHITRWAVFADSHGNRDALRSAVGTGAFDAIVHLGDGILDAAVLSGEFGIPLHGVSGNEDGAAPYPERLVVPIGAYSALMVHGHSMDINQFQTEQVWERHYMAMEGLMALAGARLFFFGHTHKPVLLKVSPGIICNPGSLFPGSQTPLSFVTVECNGEVLRVSMLSLARGGAWEKNMEVTFP
jgi:uncharacterized protein